MRRRSTRRDDQHVLAEVVHRGSDPDWLQRAQQNRRRWLRRNITIGAALLALVLVVGFLVNEGPRRSGMLDALGITCDEFVVDSGPSQQQIFEPWEDHHSTLVRYAEDHPDGAAAFGAADFITDVEEAAEELGAEPVFAAFRGWTPPSWGFSAQVIDGQLLIGHHQQLWTRTDRVSRVDPATGQADWSAELEHPLQEDWQAPERVLYGVGAAGQRVLLQTPAVNGDTALLTFDIEQDAGPECVRLDGAVDPAEVLQAHPNAWPVVMDINLGRVSDDEFLILHGLTPGEDAPLLASTVDIATQEAAEAGEYAEIYPAGAESEAGEEQQPGSVQQVGDSHYLLSWESGYVLLALSG